MLLVAHRMPTSAAACRAMFTAGADLFEVDLQFDASGLIVSHYAIMRRSGGWMQRDGWRLRLGRASGRDPSLASLRAVLPDGARLLLDPKEKEPHRRDLLVDTIVETFPDRERVVISTGRRRDLDRLREAGFETWRSIGDRATLRQVLETGALPDAGVTVRHTLLDRAAVHRLHGVVPRVVAWTVNSPARAAGLRTIGVDGITTDRVAVLVHMRATAGENAAGP